MNVLALDEPTNDLDIETLDLREEVLLGFSGTLLLVSHDRDFIDNVVPRTRTQSGPAPRRGPQASATEARLEPAPW